jgi:hypothetical protein
MIRREIGQTASRVDEFDRERSPKQSPEAAAAVVALRGHTPAIRT